MVVGASVRGCQVAVIGGGPGGYLAAIRLAQLKKDVILVEAEPSLGGICLNEGCIPSKALIHAADFYSATKTSAVMGIDVEGASVDMDRLIDWKEAIVQNLTGGVKFLAEKNGAEVLHGRARFKGERALEVDTGDGMQEIEFEQAVIATGSSAFFPPGFEPDGDVILGSREALSLREVPGKLVVIGAGYIGLELGSVYRKFGSEVTMVEFLPELLEHHDEDLRKTLSKRLDTLGIDVHLGSKATAIEKGKPSVITVERDGETFTLEADKVLVSVGRRPNTGDLGLDAAGVETDDRGFIQVNDRMETSVPGIYALGDVVGGALLAHKAYREAKVAAEVIAGEPAAFDNVVVPAVIYTDPEIAWAGMSEREAKEEGYEVVTGHSPSGLRAAP